MPELGFKRGNVELETVLLTTKLFHKLLNKQKITKLTQKEAENLTYPNSNKIIEAIFFKKHTNEILVLDFFFGWCYK